ncbi:MAG: histone deacetylase [Acidobacteria bacterium]|nr:histone deacetylase [Acidobacteriota bacterium]
MLRIHTHPRFRAHEVPPGYPENAARLDAALHGVHRAGLDGTVITSLSPTIETGRIIAKVHSENYAKELESACHDGFKLFHSHDNPISRESYAAATTAVASALTAAEEIWESGKATRGFVVARPPGHHAERAEAMGFCFFNTIACVAERLRELPGIERVFILDWDVHHGNGTQTIFEDRDDVYYASIHRYPFYPGSGAAHEIGFGKGRGFTRNIPLSGGAGDTAFVDAVETTLLPIIDDYRPDAILVSAGFDAHRRDPLGGMRVSESAYGLMTRMVVAAAERHCRGRVLSLLEGGYDPDGLASSVEEHVVAMT